MSADTARTIRVLSPGHTCFVARLLFCIALAAPAVAQEMKPEGDSPAKIALNFLKKYDSNDDGQISKSELPSPEFFKRYDQDGDNKVSAVEIRQVEQGIKAKAEMDAPKRKEYFRGLDDFGEHDLNADGRLSKKELESYIHDSCDQNRDGYVNEDEYKYVDRTPGGEEKAVDLESFEKLDENNNKSLSLKEFQLSKEYVDALDRNNDGLVSKEELIEVTIRKWGGTPGTSAESVLRRMDSNGDGELSRKEFDGNDRLWNQINGYKSDKDDPTINKDEIEKYITRVKDLRQKANTFMTRYDMNGDGKVTRDEFDGPDGAFGRCDANGDGLVTRADGVD
jgi:Ca2+-binding EF-hand superfamily protein